ncbi:hypothetical protein PM082_012675 [Marasmius tenuissimus]|nr:hypothetical protein PM082_012675 [Marasmius tenuissimus]
MHDAQIYSVSPDPPPREAYLRLEGYDLWMTFIKIVYYLPSNLDVAAFQQSLAKGLAIYWPASGRLSRDEHGWKVDSIGSSVTISTSRLLENSETSLDERVVQDDLSVFLPPSLPSGPLVSFKLTEVPGGASYLGVWWHHVLGASCRTKQWTSSHSLG